MKLRLSPWLVIALFFAAFPLLVMRPDRDQGATELRVALFLLRYQLPVELVCIGGALITVLFNWPLRTRGSLSLATGVLVSAALTQFNVFEFLFHPAGRPAFETTAESKLNPKEKLLAITLKHTSRAYPVHSVAYHHVINDVLADVPIAVTY